MDSPRAVQTIISAGFLFPHVYAPKAGCGFFSFGDNAFGNNHDHWKLPFGIDPVATQASG